MRSAIRLFAVLLILLSMPSVAGAEGILVFATDYGSGDDSASQCKAVMLSFNRNLTIVDMSHNIPQYDVRLTAFLISDSANLWPEGTVFLADVDPGSINKGIVLKTKAGRYYVGPDNGIFSMVANKEGIEKIVGIQNKGYMRATVSPTFMGRDVFSPVASWLARDDSILDNLGPQLISLYVPDWGHPYIDVKTGVLHGTVLHVEDPFGNIWTDIGAELFNKLPRKDKSIVMVRVKDKNLLLPVVQKYSDVPKGQPLAYINSRNVLSIAVNMGDISKILPVTEGDPVEVSIAPF